MLIEKSGGSASGADGKGGYLLFGNLVGVLCKLQSLSLEELTARGGSQEIKNALSCLS